MRNLGFPGGSDGTESARNAGGPGFDLWIGKIPCRSRKTFTFVFLATLKPFTVWITQTVEQIHMERYWAPLVAQRVKNLPTMQETWMRYLGWEDLLEQEMATHSNILAWRIPMDRGA